jgi:hypothetical protein
MDWERRSHELPVDCQDLFSHPHLHLLVWNRFGIQAHDAGMRLLSVLLRDTALEGQFLMLIHPLGRALREYDSYSKDAADRVGTGLPQPFPGDPHLQCCEVWFQVSDQAEAAVWGHLRNWSEDPGNSPASAWRSLPAPLWQPLGHGPLDCAYARPRDVLGASWLSRLSAEHIAWLLKVMWHRASVVIVSDCAAQQSVKRITPWCDQDGIAAMLARMLSGFELSEFGIPGPAGQVDPSAFGASHLAAFTLNAVTREVPLPAPVPTSPAVCIWQVEQFWHDPRITHPSAYGSLSEYLAAVRSARC